MKIKEKIKKLYEAIDTKFKEHFGFNDNDISFTKLVNYLHAPKDASSLAVTRILFGLAMLFDIPDERGGALLYKRWGNPKICHFPLFNFIQGVLMPYMTIVYTALWIGALGMMLGYKYRISARLFTISYWYLFLIEKSYWNNHSYLFGLVSFLLMFTDANCYWSVDAIMVPEIFSETVPYWNYFILKYQFFILYFMAGVKKGSAEWLTGYSVPNLSAHWVFTPFTLFLTIEQTDYIIVHWFIFLFDLTVAFWMMWSRTRHVAMVFCALFHLMNSRLFTIGMFPWVCLATMPLFYPFHWPKLVIACAKSRCKILMSGISAMTHRNMSKELMLEQEETLNSDNDVFDEDDDDDVFGRDVTLTENKLEESHEEIYETNTSGQVVTCAKGEEPEYTTTHRQETTTENGASLLVQDDHKNNTHDNLQTACSKKITTILIIMYMTMQCFLPFSHFITKGYNNWTDGLYGYSWDMMVHTWDVQSVIVKVVDNEKKKQFYIDPHAFSPNDRWFKHGDMIHQYAICINNTLLSKSKKTEKQHEILSKNISIFIDVWCSINGRFVQRMFDPQVDLMQVSWSTFQKIPFLMPLLDEASEWRPVLSQIRSEVHSWHPFSDVIFVADFPDYVLEKYIPPELSNVTLTILEGEIAIEPEVTSHRNSQSFQLNNGHRIHLNSGLFHRILNIGKKPAYYMFTFYNKTEAYVKNETIVEKAFKLPILTELQIRFSNMLVFGEMLMKGFHQLFFSVSKVFTLNFLNIGLNAITSLYVYIFIMLYV